MGKTVNELVNLSWFEAIDAVTLLYIHKYLLMAKFRKLAIFSNALVNYQHRTKYASILADPVHEYRSDRCVLAHVTYTHEFFLSSNVWTNVIDLIRQQQCPD